MEIAPAPSASSWQRSNRPAIRGSKNSSAKPSKVKQNAALGAMPASPALESSAGLTPSVESRNAANTRNPAPVATASAGIQRAPAPHRCQKPSSRGRTNQRETPRSRKQNAEEGFRGTAAGNNAWTECTPAAQPDKDTTAPAATST